MLTMLALRNFKCFEHVALEPQRITVLIGTNGAGKSSVLQSIAFLRQSASSTTYASGQDFSFDGPFANLGTFEDVIYRGDESRTLKVGFSATETRANIPAELEGPGQVQLDRAIEIAFRDRFLTVVRNYARIKCSGRTFDVDWQFGQQPPEQVISIGAVTFTMQAASDLRRPFQITKWGPNEEGASPSDVQRIRAAISPLLLDSFTRVIDSWRFTPTLRGFVSGTYPVRDRPVNELLPTGSYDQLSSDVASTLAINEGAEKRAAEMIRHITGVMIKPRLTTNKQVVMRTRSGMAGEMSVRVVNEGTGTNQLIFQMFSLASAPVGSLVAIEEPETHLHPKAVALLGDVLVDVAMHEQKQLLLTTHSDYLLLSLLNNVAERKLAHEDLKVYFFDRDGDQPSVREVEVTSDGLAKGGLPGFFDATLEAQRRHLQAVTARR